MIATGVNGEGSEQDNIVTAKLPPKALAVFIFVYKANDPSKQDLLPLMQFLELHQIKKLYFGDFVVINGMQKIAFQYL